MPLDNDEKSIYHRERYSLVEQCPDISIDSIALMTSVCVYVEVI